MNLKSGDIITLRGISLAGRTKINNEGAEFKVMALDSPPCLNFRASLLLESVRSGKLRWILQENDLHFAFEE